MSKVSFKTDVDVTEDIIKVFEGFRGGAYLDAVGYGTIGYGHLITPKDVDLSKKTLTEKEASLLLRADIIIHKKGEIAKLTRPVNHNQMAALTSFAFNKGAYSDNLEKMVRLINAGKEDEAAREFLNPANATAKGKTLTALQQRRQIELVLFCTAVGETIDLKCYGEKPWITTIKVEDHLARLTHPDGIPEKDPLQEKGPSKVATKSQEVVGREPSTPPPARTLEYSSAGKTSPTSSVRLVTRLWTKLRTWLG